MPDVFTAAERSAVMGTIKSHGNRSTEQVLRRLFRAFHLKGWRSHTSTLPGRPDFTFRDRQTAIFVDGCFWHGCHKCSRNLTPAKNSEYWGKKILSNRKRDRMANRKLRGMGWQVVRIWEHDLKRRPHHCVDRIARALALRRSNSR